MQLHEVEAFLAVIRFGSITEAANSLCLTQPSLSHRIQMLEDSLGTSLFLRGKGQRRIELTEAGQRFIPLAEKWIRLRDETMELGAEPIRRKFRVAATQTLSTYVMPKVYSRFVARGLPADMYLYSLHYGECYEAVATNSIDAIFVSRTISSSKVSAIPVAQEKMVLLCNESCGYSGIIEPKQLPIDKCAFMLWSLEYKLWHEYWFGSPGYRVTSDNFRLVEQILSSTDMWSIVPISAARSLSHDSGLKYYELNNAPPDRTIYLLTLEPRHEYTKYLVEDLCESLKEL